MLDLDKGKGVKVQIVADDGVVFAYWKYAQPDLGI